jgi:hypothetical protein
MDEKVKNRLFEAVDILNAELVKHNEAVCDFKTELFTDDVCQMIDTICNSRGLEYTYKTEGKTLFSMYNFSFNGISIRCKYGKIIPKADDSTLDSICHIAKELERSKQAFKLLQDEAGNIIKDITTKYKSVTESQNAKLDEVFAMLKGYDAPVRHIKVTVEWIEGEEDGMQMADDR